MNQKFFNKNDASQESQYEFPYHYIPSLINGHFSQHLYWSWGYCYLGGVNLVLDLLANESFDSLADIGCGDGRLLREIARRFSDAKLVGFDYSEHAIKLAQAMNPQLEYICRDICTEKPGDETYDVITLVEVLEHIPVNSAEEFIAACAGMQKSGNRIIITTPHKNKKLQPKHYQHFDTASLTKILEPYYQIDRFIYFDKIAPISRRFINMILSNRLFILNNHLLLDILFKLYSKRLLICKESKCGRICIKGHKK